MAKFFCSKNYFFAQIKTFCFNFVAAIIRFYLALIQQLIPHIMEKRKRIADNQSTSKFRNAAAIRSRGSNKSPGRMVHPNVEALPLSVLFRQIWLRVRRTWIAFRYQMNRYTFGLFRRAALVKISVLAVAGYFLLWPSAPGLKIVSDSSQPTAGNAVETSLEVTGSSIFGEKNAEKPKVSKPKNDAAPVSANELADQETQDYIQRYAKTAQTEMAKFGIPASISLAQGLIESRSGTSKLAVNNNNHFGIKCFSRKCKKGHCSNHTDDTHKDFFRKFSSPWESWRAHSQMLANGRYRQLKKYGKDYRKWAQGLKNIGYATDRNYAEKLIGVIERYNLHQFDK